MMTLLAEQPLLVSIMLGVLSAGLFYGWLQSGKRAAAICGAVAALLIPLAWLLASSWETEREQVEAMIYAAADAVENNDFERVYQFIGDEATRERARTELPNYEFTIADVNRIRRIDLIEGTYPPEADVDMSVKATVSHRGGRFHDVRVPRRLILRLEKRGDNWTVVDYQHMPIAGGPDNFTTTMPQR